MRSSSLIGWLALLFVLAGGAGCNTMEFEVARSGRFGEEVHDRKAFYFWGLTPTRKIDVREHCPNGVRFILEETTFGDGLLRFITIGIYAPRTTNYDCLEERADDEANPEASS